MHLGRPPDISAHGSVDGSLDLPLLVLAAIFALALVWLVVAVLRGQKEKGSGTFSENGGHFLKMYPTPFRFRAGRGIVVLAVIFFVAVDVPLMMRPPLDDASSERALHVRLVARQWAWESRHAGRDGVLGTADDVVTLGELRLPAGRPVTLELESVDVVHALNLPNLRVQRDIVPGQPAVVHFEAAAPGDYQLTCAQFCGPTHFQMIASLRVRDGDAFDAWLDEASDRAAREANAHE